VEKGMRFFDFEVQGVEGFFDGRRGVGAVDLVKVDVVGAKTLKAVFDLVEDVPAGVAALVGPLAHFHGDLGGDDEVVAVALDGLADAGLRLPCAVDVGCVDEGDALFTGFVEDGGGSGGVDAAAEVVAADADGGDLEAGGAEVAVSHLVIALSGSEITRQ
jgi:hypothetical protein